MQRPNQSMVKIELPKAQPEPKQKASVLVCIFNYNNNENALKWKELLSPHFSTIILDSGSNPPCANAVKLDNIYYGGMFNESIQRAKKYKWCCIVTSDVIIDEANAKRLITRINEVCASPRIGNYQPSCDRSGRSHDFGYNKGTGTQRSVPYMEGWFQLFRTILGFKLPLNINRIGWGTDMYLCKRALKVGLSNIVDDSVVVLHPHGSGFDNNEARKQMDKWTATLPDWENKIKVGLAINAFEGTEHIRETLKQIGNLVDVVAVFFQKESYNGIKADEADINEIESIKSEGLVRDIVEFIRMPYVDAREQETIKRNQCMSYMEKQGCDYTIVIDSDEFYSMAEFINAKDYVRRILPDATYCYYLNFYKDKYHILVDDCYDQLRAVPFLCRSNLRFKYNMPCRMPSDVTRRIDNHSVVMLPKEAIQMYHWSWIRNDIRKKMGTWSSLDHFTSGEREAMIESWEKFDGTQEYVNVPHKICNNKVKVVKIE